MIETSVEQCRPAYQAPIMGDIDDLRSHLSGKVSSVVNVQDLTSKPATENARFPHLKSLYSSSHYARIWHVASKALAKNKPPSEYPEYTKTGGGEYMYQPLEYWTFGFFPGSLYQVYERQRRWPEAIRGSQPLSNAQLRQACEIWTTALHGQASRTDTHDLGFMIQPWASKAWKLDQDAQCYDTLITAAHSLAFRFNEKVGCLRSWDRCFTKRYQFTDPDKDFLVIIDNMMNLDMLYEVAELTSNPKLAEIATTHALTCMESHFRDSNDGSTYHVVNFDPDTGDIRQRLTNQGYSDTSCWSRGQAWAIAGFAQVYNRTKDDRFLATSRKAADYFITQLTDDGVPRWDFQAPETDPKDTSAGLIASFGMLFLYDALREKGDEMSSQRYLHQALRIIDGTCKMCLAPEARFVAAENGPKEIHVDAAGHDTIVLNATTNNYEFAPRRWADHGLVYADYYFLLVGNQLLERGILVD